MRFYDSHLHLCEYQRPDQFIPLMEYNGTAMLSAGIDRATSMKTLELSKRFPRSVIPFVGVHPSEAGKESDLSWVRDAVTVAAGVGEIGLDPGYPTGGVRDQLGAFEEQLEVAEKARKPVQVHSRGAERECLDALGRYKLEAVLVHWFEDERLLGAVRERGYYLSFGPAISQSRKLKRMAAASDGDRLLSETDAPVSFRLLDGSHGPFLIPTVVFELSRARGSTFEETRRQCEENAERYLGLGKG